MLLNDKQLRILKLIEAGNTTGESIGDAMGSSMQMIRYYLDTLAEDGYLKIAKVYDNATREFHVVRAYLTDQGKAAIALQVPEGIVAAKPAILNATPTQPLQAENFDQVLKRLETMQPIVEQLSSDRREVATVYLEDLQSEIKVVYRRNPRRIKAYFLALLGTTLPVVQQTNGAASFIEQCRYLSEQFNIPVKLPQPDVKISDVPL